ncbi:MAG: lipocalin-like domain-containing protein [Hyphomicrobium sp.]
MPMITGTWQLVRTVANATDGTEMPPPYGGEKAMGRVVLNADGRMMAVLIDGRSEPPDGVTREYTSYCGSYTFNGKQLVTRVDAASDPARLGTDQVRAVRFEDGLMVLRPPVRSKDGKQEQRELYWQKISDT